MAADNWLIFNKFKEYKGDGTIDLDNDTFKAILVLSSWTPDLTDSLYADVSGDELANGNGYTTGGVTLSGVTWVESAGTVTFDCNDFDWSASGGDLTFRYCLIYDDTAVGDPLVCYSLLDNTPANVTIVDGTTMTIQINASGIFQEA